MHQATENWDLPVSCGTVPCFSSSAVTPGVDVNIHRIPQELLFHLSDVSMFPASIQVSQSHQVPVAAQQAAFFQSLWQCPRQYEMWQQWGTEPVTQPHSTNLSSSHQQTLPWFLSLGVYDTGTMFEFTVGRGLLWGWPLYWLWLYEIYFKARIEGKSKHKKIRLCKHKYSRALVWSSPCLSRIFSVGRDGSHTISESLSLISFEMYVPKTTH